MQVGLDGDDLAGAEGAAGIGLDHLGAQLMADHAGVFEIGLVALVDVIVGAADADPADPHQHLARLPHRLRPVDQAQRFGLLAEDGFHHSSVSGHRGAGPKLIGHIALVEPPRPWFDWNAAPELDRLAGESDKTRTESDQSREAGRVQSVAGPARSDSAPPAIAFSGISVAYPLKGGGRYVALAETDLVIADGEFTAIVEADRLQASRPC